ncbi:hypothetical protein CONLIGDRAFT_643245 [Coniochaeta ligniaria NRRL 30616]|uniref:Uncharacterized protein n=1 Tax=Coniochaeta ligniaria NRRL 30616 TaxID=1408157 RepID=A0A1J7JD19_9PEZI|nr:hypothetical protein CONLIGDRAFT_643245 [Coniochaeta ligniaria NRRL 30616]
MDFTALCLFLILMVSHLGCGLPQHSNVSASPAEHAALDPCDGVNGSPILYHQYNDEECPAMLHKQDDGYCEFWDTPATEGCASFCQTNTTFTRAQEAPFPMSECHWPAECTLSKDQSASWNWGFTVSPKVGKALKLGVSGGYGESYGTSTGFSWKFTPAPHECGYFTYVPTKKTSCGQLVQAENTWWWWFRYCYDPVAFETYCAEQTWKVDGQPDGVVIFVKIDCVTRAPMPMDQQDPIYGLPGVALDRGVLSTTMSGWVKNTCRTRYTGTDLGFQYGYEIRGKNFAQGPLGANGEHLKEKIDACGLPSGCDFSFLLTPDNPDFDWVVTGCMPLTGKPSCIGNAIMAVGGTTRDQCV